MIPEHGETPLPPELLEQALDELLAAPTAGRAAVCARFAAENPAHAPALQRLLRRLGGAERLLSASFPDTAADEDLPSIHGHAVVRRLGQGAFGTVYLCAQQHPVARHVAIKVVRATADEHDLLRRFHKERQVLASLSHPAIAHLYDAGCLPDGRPYFVMEFVDGVPITEYCRTRALPTEDRLRLFVALCHGVEHAHAQGVVHRDLKPGNVLVVESAGGRRPKIIDFGIAKALMRDTDALPATDAGRVMGTPGYMSPEQALGDVERIDARTDVFALGVMLYELLTGDLPWPRGAHYETATDPALPSARITKNARRLPNDDLASARRLAARVRGDLDWITLKAVQREPEGRYASARALAEDLERHLAGRPVLAGPPTLVYRLGKLVRRHRVATVALLATVVVTASGIALASWHTGRAVAAADARYTDALAAADRLPQRAGDANLRRTPRSEPLRTALAADALAFYDRWLEDRPDDPALRARRCRALSTLSEVHSVLGQIAAAQRTAEEASREAAELFALAPESLDARALLAGVTRMRVRALQVERDYAGSLPFCEQAVRELEVCAATRPDPWALELAQALRELSLARQVVGDRDGSEAASRRSIAVLEDLVARDVLAAEARDDLVWAHFTLAAHATERGAFDAADAAITAAEAGLATLRGDRRHATATVLCQKSQIAWFRGDVPAAALRTTAALEACEAWLEAEPDHVRAHATLFQCARQLARVHEAHGDPDAALTAMQRTLRSADAKAELFPEDPARVRDQRMSLYEFARALWNRYRHRDLAQASAWLARCKALGGDADGRPLSWEVQSVAAWVADAEGHPTDTAWAAVAAILPRERALGADEPAQQVVEGWLGVARHRLGRGDSRGARDALRHTEHYLQPPHPVDPKLRSELAWVRARVELADGDLEAAASACDAILELRPSWWGHWRAGGVALEAWRHLAAEPAAEADVWRDRAAASHRHVVEALAERVASARDDPWLGVPFGLAHLALAEIEAERGAADAAREHVRAALDVLERVAGDAHRDLFDANTLEAGRALAARLGASRR